MKARKSSKNSKRKKPRKPKSQPRKASKQSSDVAGTFPFEIRQYPLEAVATVAAQLNQNDDPRSNARQAYALLDAIDSEARLRNGLQRMSSTEPGARLRFNEAVERITGLKDEYAREQYREFCEEVVVRLWAQVEGLELADTLEATEPTSSDPDDVEIDPSEFARRWVKGQKEAGLSEIEIGHWEILFRLSKPTRGSKEWRWKQLLASMIRLAEQT